MFSARRFSIAEQLSEPRTEPSGPRRSLASGSPLANQRRIEIDFDALDGIRMQYDETARKSIQRESKEFFHSADGCGEVAELSVELLIQRSFSHNKQAIRHRRPGMETPLTRKAGTATGA
jgi:hypothetical protein